jgi:dihydrolipoamide dehydrogenase
MDRELSAFLRNELSKKGIEFHLGAKVVSVNNRQVEIEKAGEKSVLETSKILLSVGRKPVLAGFGLEALDLELFGNGLKVNQYMQTSHPDIYACGDITGFSLLAHTAVREAEVAVGHILGKNEKMSYKAIPGVVYTNPEIAGAGKTEEVLQAEKIAYTVKQLPMAYSGRFVAENEQGNGVCKILEGEDGAILGVHILGNPASEIIVIAGIAIEKGLKADDLKTMIFPHPTGGEIIRETL